ncbi:NADH-quinone oxidoreductase subunit NuoF [Desulfurispirillum indicum]|uniref:NADH-quinone oxidoreductase subunit F n=1 Tax=Desulfurispirillum indicum (strain ATCC BAA-1389 / DSM 22839 / S5) TaxID=653733 RepID=E6W2P2_DESIS|nr:NADH-quinone oxidoreductase subunit NuoF [Desulfurispirillum indicum]ADU65626.1 NADH-quinone oxidoreductase, F subunit [Desulfurispirillum indicum S5]UCZ57539.1 NADH-quinone oxidoreductase subunit NuoF [Desulfurispirillum indicum]
MTAKELKEVKVLSAKYGIANSFTLDVARQHGGYAQIDKAFSMSPDQIVEEVKQSGLRGRGGAGFPAGMKWSFLPKETDKPIYLAVNSDESEPGTFKDRQILEKDPHMLIEGIIITCYAIKSHDAYIYIRGEYVRQAEGLQRAIDEAYAAGLLGENACGKGYRVDVTVHRGAGAYICGEEMALLESIEGKKGQPRVKPPFPALVGLYGAPTIINNVQTIASVPYIIEHGAAGYRQFGTEKSPGTFLFGISGHVEKPGVYETELGVSMKEFIDKMAGGIWKGRKLKAVIPGGSSCPVLNAEDVEKCTLDYESLVENGSMLGSGGMIVSDDQTCMVRNLKNLLYFYQHESCGQCTPCREGTGWIYKIVSDIEDGKGKMEDLDLLLEICDNMEGKTVCVLSGAAAMPCRSHILKFRQEFEEHIKLGKCPFPK